MKKLVFTGGHHNSALALAKEMKKRGYQIYWIGHKFAHNSDKSLSAEYQEVTRNKIPFYELKTGKFYRKINPLEWLKIIFGFFQSLSYLISINPKIVVSFGGYLSVPVVWSGKLLGKKVVLHEQTVIAGWANRVTSPFSDVIYLTHKESLRNYPSHKTVVAGLPLNKNLLIPHKRPKSKIKTIYVTCGKQGSHIINSVIFKLIPRWVENYKVIHQTGNNPDTKDADRARRVKISLPKKYKARYTHRPYFFEKSVANNLKSADLIISRSGAHTVFEILYLQKKSILIPIPWVSHNEQYLNAKLVESKGLAQIIEEKDLTPELVDQSVKDFINKRIPKVKSLVTSEGLKVIADDIEKRFF